MKLLSIFFSYNDSLTLLLHIAYNFLFLSLPLISTLLFLSPSHPLFQSTGARTSGVNSVSSACTPIYCATASTTAPTVPTRILLRCALVILTSVFYSNHLYSLVWFFLTSLSCLLVFFFIYCLFYFPHGAFVLIILFYWLLFFIFVKYAWIFIQYCCIKIHICRVII